MEKISFGTPIDPMGPDYSEADLNDRPVSHESHESAELSSF